MILGSTIFKIQGRTNLYSGSPSKAVSHYIEEHYEGNYCKGFAEKSISKSDIAILDIMDLMKEATKDIFIEQISKHD